MAAGVVHQVLSQLLRCGHSEGGGKTSTYRSGVVQVKHPPRKVCAVAKEQVEVAAIGFVVEGLDQPFILLRCRFDFESINLAVIERAYELNPVSLRRLAIAGIRDEIEQMFAPPRITHCRFL